MVDFKSESGVRAQGNSIFEQNVDVHGNLTVNTNVIVEGNLSVNGSFDFTIDTSSLGDVLPTTTGNDLGNTTNRWDGFFTNVTCDGYIYPTSNGISLGNTTNRWDGYFESLDVSANASFGDDVLITGDLTISGNTDLNGLIVSSLIANNAALIGNVASVATNAVTVIDSFPKTQANAWKYIVGMTTNLATSIFVTEIICGHNDSFAYTSKYGEISVSANVTLSVDISGSDIQLSATCPNGSGANTHVFNVMRIELSN